MTLEERVAKLEQRIDQADRIDERLGHIEQDVSVMAGRLGRVEDAIVGLRTDFAEYRRDNGAVLGRILASIEELQRRPIVFRWPWER